MKAIKRLARAIEESNRHYEDWKHVQILWHDEALAREQAWQETQRQWHEERIARDDVWQQEQQRGQAEVTRHLETQNPLLASILCALQELEVARTPSQAVTVPPSRRRRRTGEENA